MIYLVGWSALCFTFFISSFSRYRGCAFGLFTILIFAGIAIFRGSTGTDTANYELMLSKLSLDTIWGTVEPGFAFVGLFLTEMLGSAEAGVRAVSVLFFVLVTLYYFRADKNEEFVLLAYLAPAYFYIYSMNGLRIGIASIVLLLAVQTLRRGYVLKSGATMLIAVLFHYTILFSIGYLLINFFKGARLKYVFLLGLLVLLLFHFASENIFFRLSSYSDFESPNSLSGLSKIIVILLLVFSAQFSSLPSPLRIRIVLSTILFTSFAIAATAFSYVGLRFLDLIAFVIPIAILMIHSESEQLFNWKTKLFFLLSGFASAAAVYRGFLIEAGQGRSPFMPYEVINVPYEVINRFF